MSQNKLVSVIIPSFNHEKYIEQAIESVFQQSYRPLELIVVDDCSGDRSPKIISSLKARYRKLDSNFKFSFFRKSKNSDAPTTINFGLSKARGEYVTILNSDDYYAPDRIKTLVDVASAKNKELLFTDVEIVDSKGTKLPGQHPRVHWLHEALSFRHETPSVGYSILKQPYVVTSGNLFFKRSLLKTLKGFRNYRVHHDWDFVLRATRFTEPFFVSKRLIFYRIHNSNTISETSGDAQEVGRLSNARSECEIRRIIEDFYEETMMTSHSQKSGLNPLAPIPDFWPKNFLNFFKNGRIWFSQQPYFTEISFCNRSLVETPESALTFFKTAGMAKEDIVQSLRVFPEITYLHIENFPRRVQKNYPALKITKTSQIETEDFGQIGTLVTIAGKFKKTPPLLQDSYVAIIRGERLAGVARAVYEKSGTLTYLGLIREPLHDDELRKLKLVIIEPNRHLDYTLCFPRLSKTTKKRTWKHEYRTYYGNVDHLQTNGPTLAVAGWSARHNELPVAVQAFFNGKLIPILPSLYYRPDLTGLLDQQNKASIAGFRFSIDLIFHKLFDVPEGVLEVRSQFKDIGGVLERFSVKKISNGFLITQHASTRPTKKSSRKRKS